MFLQENDKNSLNAKISLAKISPIKVGNQLEQSIYYTDWFYTIVNDINHMLLLHNTYVPKILPTIKGYLPLSYLSIQTLFYIILS